LPAHARRGDRSFHSGVRSALTDNGSSAKQKWKFSIAKDDTINSAAIGPDGTVYVGSVDDNLYALAPKGGRLEWKFTTDSNVNSSPAIGPDGTIYVGSTLHHGIGAMVGGGLAFQVQPAAAALGLSAGALVHLVK